jgi:3-oxoacyl-[acyl-carrier-protein] synthase II
LAAALEAWTDSGLRREDLDPFEAGVIIGSSHGGEGTLMGEASHVLDPGSGAVNPLLIPRLLGNMAAAQVAIALGLRGPSFATTSACATGAHAIGEAAETIRRGDAMVMLCGAAEACITRLTVAGDDALGALSRRNADPGRASRPFDLRRDGFVLGEGAGVLVLEDFDWATARGARIYGEMTGYGATSDATHETRPAEDASGAARAMLRALAKGGVAPGGLGAVFAHATSTRAGDLAESRALRLVLGDAASRVPVTAVKSMLGHALGAAGAIQAVAAVKALESGVVPPTINCETFDADCGPLCLAQEAVMGPMRHVASNSFGFGGHNVCLVFSR